MTQLTPSRFKQSDVVRNQWHAEPEYGTPMEALLKPEYWAHVSAKLRRGDRIYALAEDNLYHAGLLVIEAGRLFAKVVKIPGECFEIESTQILNIDLPEGYDVKYRGLKKNWCVLRGTDVLKDGLSKTEAEAWVIDHLKLKKKAAA